MEEVVKFLENNIDNQETIVVATSGGPDSMCLLELINRLKDKNSWRVICAHVNHKLRCESEEEALMVKEYAKRHQDVFEYLEINEYKNGKFSENDARKKRYEFFFSLMDKYKSKILLTAHHGDDLIETVLMRINRGSNLSGYMGIKLISDKGRYKIIRPLLLVDKQEILKYANENNIPYRIDKSNEYEKYTRNRYRKEVVPFLKKENNKVHRKYLKYAIELEEYDNFVNDYIESKHIIVDNKINIDKVNKESSFIKRKCIEFLVRKIQEEDYFDISDNQVLEMVKLIEKNNKTVDLNNGYKGINSYGFLKIEKSKNYDDVDIIIDKDLELLDYKFYYNSKDISSGNDCVLLDSHELVLPLRLRTWHNGDKMLVKNLGGSKLISDIMINSKVEKEKRKGIPVLVDSKDVILWIPNLKKSQFCKEISEKYDIIIKCEAR